MKLFFLPVPSVSVNKCDRSFNSIDDRHAQVCVPNKVKNMDVKVFNLMSRVNFQFNMNHASVNVEWMKASVIQSKNGIIMIGSVRV